MKVNNKTSCILTATVLSVAALPATADTAPTWRDGRIVRIWADPSDVVMNLDIAGPCGSTFYHIQRSNQNFNEFSALMYTAASLGKQVHVYVASCNGDRNIMAVGSSAF